MSPSAATFWVDRFTHLIRKVAGEITIRFPASEKKQTKKHTTLLRRMVVNQPIAPEVFEFTPPPDVGAIGDGTAPGGDMIRGGMRFGRAGFSGGQGTWIESSESSDWTDGTYFRQGKLRLQGVELMFEQRIAFSEGAKEIRIIEHITGPNGQAEHEFHLPLA